MGPSFVILTESSCDLTAELAERAEIEVLPLTFTMEGRTYAHYPDWREMPREVFYGKMKSGVPATTAAANVAELSEAMERHLRAGKDVLFLCFTSGLSSSRDACEIAAAELREQYPERTVETVDTLSAAVGQGLLVLLAGQARLRGKSLREVRDFVLDTRARIAHWFTVDNLSTLKRGGRISTAAAAVGTMLQIKPILRVDEEGRLASVDKARGRKASMQSLVRRMEESALRPVKIAMIAHGNSPEDAEELRQQIEKRLHPEEVLIVPLGPVIGAHVGPGFLALTFLAEHR